MLIKKIRGSTVTNIQQKKERVAMLSVASNSVLVLFKVIVGVVIGSVSIISEAIHSGVDLLASIIAMFSVKTSSVPADDLHPFGHGRSKGLEINGRFVRRQNCRPPVDRPGGR